MPWVTCLSVGKCDSIWELLRHPSYPLYYRCSNTDGPLMQLISLYSHDNTHFCDDKLCIEKKNTWVMKSTMIISGSYFINRVSLNHPWMSHYIPLFFMDMISYLCPNDDLEDIVIKVAAFYTLIHQFLLVSPIGALFVQVVRSLVLHDDVIKWKHFPRYWPFVREIHRSPMNSPHKGQWRGALMFSLICVWIITWVNNREAGDSRRYHAYYDVTVMTRIVYHGQHVA